MFFVQSCGSFCGSGFAVLSHLLHFSLRPHHRWLSPPSLASADTTRETETSLDSPSRFFRSCKARHLSISLLIHSLPSSHRTTNKESVRVFFCSFSLHLTFVTIGNQSTDFISQVEESLASCLHREKISPGVMILKQRTPSPLITRTLISGN